jgi:hypothetical protein
VRSVQVGGEDPRVPDALFAPYLPLIREATVGPWRLVPFKDIDDCAAVPAHLRRQVTQLVEAYRPGGGPSLGAVASPSGIQVEAPLSHREMRRLGHALLAGAMSCNPAMVGMGDVSPNAGHAMTTAENALVYGHPLGGTGNSYATVTGMLVRISAIHRATEGKPLPPIAAPVELPKPRLASFDDELADATYSALDEDEAAGRRLGRALDWYRIALTNAEAVTLDVRVGATRSALEVLTDSGDQTQALVRAFGRLTRVPDTPEKTYDRGQVFWAKGPTRLIPNEWWLTRLCQLRNAIVHGDDVPDELWYFGHRHQLDHIHDQLIDALRIKVANATDDQLLRRPPTERRLHRHTAAHAQRLRDGFAEAPGEARGPRPK